MEVVTGNLDLFLRGARTTVTLTVLSFAAAMVIGTVVAAFRVSPVPPLRLFGAFYVETLRNTPLAVLTVLFFFGLTKVGIKYGAFTSAVIVLTGYTSAFIAEAVRSGINAVARGQAEAARALGLTFPQTLSLVVLPQALRTVVAPLGNLFVALIKNSAVAATIMSVIDLTEVADRLNTATARPIPVFLGSAAIYVILGLVAGSLISVVERRVAIKR